MASKLEEANVSPEQVGGRAAASRWWHKAGCQRTSMNPLYQSARKKERGEIEEDGLLQV